jgi:hypothetical protein
MDQCSVRGAPPRYPTPNRGRTEGPMSGHNVAFWRRAKTGVRSCQIGKYLEEPGYCARAAMRRRSDLLGWFIKSSIPAA